MASREPATAPTLDTLEIHLTAKGGSEAVAIGNERCIQALEMALTKAGWLYHEPTGSWDEGFYADGHA